MITLGDGILRLIVLVGVAGLALSTTNLLPPRSYCGFQHIDDYPRDNENVTLDEFPWIALVLESTTKYPICAGTLINNRYVITAAHCAYRGILHEHLAVRLGEFNVITDVDCLNHTTFGEECSDPVQEYSVEEVILHPGYNLRAGKNDIALLRLSTNVQYSEYVRPICMPSSKQSGLNEEVQLTASGWRQEIDDVPPVVRKMKFAARWLPIDECTKLYKNSRKQPTNDHVCAVEVRETSACRGESGSPLMLSVKNQWEQVGTVTFGMGCGVNYPTVFVKITSYLDWIKENLRA